MGIGSVGTSLLPVLPTTFSTSGNFSNNILEPFEMASIEVCKLLPVNTLVSTAKSPSSNDGMNCPPIKDKIITATMNNETTAAITILGKAITLCKVFE